MWKHDAEKRLKQNAMDIITYIIKFSTSVNAILAF